MTDRSTGAWVQGERIFPVPAEAYNWDRCTHEGIGLPGCPTCDPDKNRCLERAEFLHERELAAVIKTADRWRADLMRMRGMIGKARKALRDGGCETTAASRGTREAYKALDLRARR